MLCTKAGGDILPAALGGGSVHMSLNTPKLSCAHNTSSRRTDNFLIHTHTLYEVYYYVGEEGVADYLVEGTEYHLRPHTVILLSPGVFHGIRVNNTQVYDRYTVHFSPELLGIERRQLLLSCFQSTELTSGQIYFEGADAFNMRGVFEAFITCAHHTPELSEALAPALLEALLARVLIMSRARFPLAGPDEARRPERGNQTVEAIIAYLNEHFTQPITLDMLAERFFISKHYMNRAFYKATGTSVIDYLLKKRVTYAQQLIINGVYAAQAAAQAGFNEYTSFYRAYVKRFGHAPSRDRGEDARQKSIANMLKDLARNGSVEDDGTPVTPWKEDDVQASGGGDPSLLEEK